MATRRRGLASARKAAGHTQESLAAELEVERTTVIRWEAGDHEPQPYLWPRLAGLLGIPTDELRMLLDERPVPSAQAAPAELLPDRPVLGRRSVLLGSAGAALMLGDAESLRRGLAAAVDHAAMSDATLDDWERAVHQYGLAHHYRPAASLLVDLTADIAELRRVLEHRRAMLVPTRMTRVMAQLSGLMSATLLRLDQQTAARNWARTAKVVASEAGDHTLHAWVLSQEAYSHYYDGNQVEALHFARHAQHVANRAACPAVANSAALEARVQAAFGRAKETRAALDRAGQALGRLGPEDQLPSAFCYNESKFAHHTGGAYTQLGRTQEAAEAQHRALALYPQSDYFNRPLVLLDRADCLVRDDDIPAAADTAIQALRTTGTDHRNPVIDNRARQVLAHIPASATTLPAVQDLRDQLHDATAR